MNDEPMVTCGGGPPGDPNGERAALAVEWLVRKYECGSGRENMRAALLEAYMLGAKTLSERMRDAGFTRRMLRRGEEGVVCARSECQCEREGLGHQCIWLSYEMD